MRRVLPSFLLLAACATAPAPKPLIGPNGFDVSGVNRAVAPCDDFYEFAVGGWRKSHPLPAAFPRFGRFEEVAERNRETLRNILEEAGRAQNADANTQKIGNFYAACMNTAAIDAQGATPIRPLLDRIDAIGDRAALAAELFRLQQRGIYPVFRFSAQNDFKNSKSIIAAISPSGLGLPDRDYYLRDDERFRRIREQYVAHAAKMFELAGAGTASDAQRVLALETQLAKAMLPRVEQRNPERVYNITPVAELPIDWSSFLREIGLPALDKVNVTQPAYLAEAGRLLGEVPLEDWKAYLRFRVIEDAAPALATAFVDEDFAFHNRILSGQQQQLERWNRCVRATDAAIGQLVGQEYVRRTFTPEAKRKMDELIDNLVAALREDIPTLDWMGPETKRAAMEKLNAFARRIGYPNKWRDYSSLAVGRDSYAANALAASEFSFRRGVARIGKPDDPEEWGFFTPATVNAGYQPSRNDITFPAGILQPPFYDPKADDAYNYGGIGTVIGHEMTHGFDDQGAKFDAAGNLRNWWTPDDLKNFQSRAECIANQYAEFAVEPGLNIQGKLVTGEAIADLGGATLALRAYQKSLEGKPRRAVDGFTPEQRFFLGFAQVWGENMAIEEQRRRALTDPHAQGPFRVNGTVSNMPEFARAFGCNAQQRMVREASKRCAIW